MNNNFEIVVGVRLNQSKVETDLKDIQNLVNKKDLNLNLKFNDSEVIRQINNIDRNFKNVHNTVHSMNNGIMDSVASLAKFTAASTVLYGTFSQIKEMVTYLNEQNSKQINIAMIGDYSLDKVKSLSQEYGNLAGKLHSTKKEAMDAAENFLRAGNSIEASKNLIKSATIGAGISGQSNKEISEQLIAIANGFKLNTENGQELLGVIDKISTADNKSATSFKEISDAMKNCSNSAQVAKVDLTHLVAYLSIVESVTRKNASSIGESFKAQFARYQNVKGGKNFDETGDLSNVERDLQKYANIKIRSDVGTFKSYEETIDTLKSKWSSLSEVSRAAISKAMAGVTHAEDFQALMNNMDKVDEMLKDLGNSAGSAEKKFNDLYSKSTTAKINDLRHAQEQLFDSMLSSDKINFAIEGLTHFLNTLELMITTEKRSAIELAAVSTSVVLLIKNFTKLNAMLELFTVISKGVGVTNTLTGTMSALGTSIAKSGASLLAFATNPVTLAIMGLGVLAGVIIRNLEHQRQLKQETDQLKTSYESLTQAMKENNVEAIKSNSVALEKEQKSLQDLIKKQTEAKKLLDEATEKYNKNPTTGNENALIKASTTYDAITRKIQEQEKVFKDAGVSFETLANAKNQLANNEYINKIKEETDIQVNHNNQIISQIQEYQNLNNVENKNATQKARMSQLANELASNLKDLTIVKDKDGNVTIQNTALLSKNIDMLNSENSTVQTSAKVKMESAKQNAQWQINETTVTYQEILKRIKLYEEEMNTLNENQRKLDKIDLRIKNGTATDADKTEADNIARGLMNDGDRIARNLQSYQQAKNNLDAIYNSTSKVSDGLNKNTNELNDGYTPALNDATKASKENANAVAKSKDIMRDFNNALKDINNTIYAQELALKGLDDSSESYRTGLQNEIKLLREKNDMLDKGIALAKDEVSSLNAKAGTTSNGVTGLSGGTWTGKYSTWINDAAAKNGLDPILIAAIIQQESSFNPNDVNSSSGATGLGQFLASTAREEGITDRKDPQQSIYGLAGYLKKRIGWAGGDLWAGVRGYGEGTKEYENLIRGWYNKFSNGQLGDGGGSSLVTSSTSSLASEADNIQSTLESLEKEKLDNNQKIIELYKGMFDSKIKEFDNKINEKDIYINIAKENASLFNSGSSEQTQYFTEQSKLINERYGLLVAKDQYIQQEMQNNVYDKKTLAEMKKSQLDIKSQEISTIKQLHDSFSEMWTADYKSKIKIYDDNIATLQNKVDVLNIADKNNYQEKIKINNQIIDQEELKAEKIKEQIKLQEDLLNKEKYDSTKTIIRQSIDDLNKDYIDTIKKQNEAKNNAVEMAKTAMDMIDNMESKIAAVIKKEVETQKESYDKDLENFRNTVEEKKNLINEQYNSEDYQRKLADENQKKQDIQNKINVLSLDDSMEAQAQVVELRKQLTDQQKNIDDMVRQHNRDEETKALDKQLSDQEKLVKEKKDALDKQYTDEKVNIITKQALQDGYYKDVKGKIQDIQTALISYEDQWGKGLTTIGGKIKSEIIDNLTQVKSLLSQVPTLENTINSANSSSSKLQSSNIGTMTNGKVYASGADLQNAQMYLSGQGYTFVDVSDGKEYTANSGDIIVGGEAVTKNIANNGAKRLWGADRFKTANAIKEFANELENKGYSYRNGGLINHDHIGVLHGSSTNWESVLNQPQLTELVSKVTNNSLNKFVSNFLPSVTIPQLPQFSQLSTTNNSGDVNFHFDKLINVEGNVTKDTMPDMQKITSHVLNELKSGLDRSGIVRVLY